MLKFVNEKQREYVSQSTRKYVKLQLKKATEIAEKTAKEKEEKEAEIAKLKSNRLLYDNTKNPFNANVNFGAYDKGKLFKAGEQIEPIHLRVSDNDIKMLGNMQYTEFYLAVPRAKLLENIEETKTNTFITFGK